MITSFTFLVFLTKKPIMNNHIEWNLEEFKTYVLLYASEIDHKVTEEERSLLEIRLNKDALFKMKKEIKLDNDYQRLQKILDFIKVNELTDNDLTILFDNIKEVFMSDNQFDTIEKATFSFLKKILKV